MSQGAVTMVRSIEDSLAHGPNTSEVERRAPGGRHVRSYADVSERPYGRPPAPSRGRLSGEVLRADVLDEVAELVDDLLGLLLGLGRRLLADLVEELLGGEQRGRASHGERDRVRGPAGDHRDAVLRVAQVELGEVRV